MEQWTASRCLSAHWETKFFISESPYPTNYHGGGWAFSYTYHYPILTRKMAADEAIKHHEKAPFYFQNGAFAVIPLGFEPRTRTLKVYCSTS